MEEGLPSGTRTASRRVQGVLVNETEKQREAKIRGGKSAERFFPSRLRDGLQSTTG